jgi:hypothetical protein
MEQQSSFKSHSIIAKNKAHDEGNQIDFNAIKKIDSKENKSFFSQF